MDATGGTYIQSAPNLDGSWLVEHRAGSADRHFATRVVNLGMVHGLLTTWVFNRPGWESPVTWSPVIL